MGINCREGGIGVCGATSAGGDSQVHTGTFPTEGANAGNFAAATS